VQKADYILKVVSRHLAATERKLKNVKSEIKRFEALIKSFETKQYLLIKKIEQNRLDPFRRRMIEDKIYDYKYSLRQTKRRLKKAKQNERGISKRRKVEQRLVNEAAISILKEKKIENDTVAPFYDTGEKEVQVKTKDLKMKMDALRDAEVKNTIVTLIALKGLKIDDHF